MLDFDIILGTAWLSPYHVVLKCNAYTVILAMPRTTKLKWEGVYNFKPANILLYVQGRRLLERGVHFF